VLFIKKIASEVIFKGNDAYYKFEDTKTTKLLLNLNKIQKCVTLLKVGLTTYFS